MAKSSAKPRRYRMRQHARRESARAWVASGAPVSVKAVARRYGVDCYTAYADLIAVGVRLDAGRQPLGGPADSRAEAAAGRAC
jgi:hypothetical protein